MTTHDERVSTGVPGLDTVLRGGLLAERAYLVRGGPGCGKTTLGLQFLTARPGEPALFVTLGEQPAQIRADGLRQGFDLRHVDFVDLTPARGTLDELESYEVMAPAEVDDTPIGRRLHAALERTRPSRVFVDSLSHLQYLAPDAFQYRKKVLALLRYLTGRQATVLSAAETQADPASGDALAFLSDGVIHLGWQSRRRTLTVSKLRGSDYCAGPHTVRIDARGMACFPRLRPDDHGRRHARETLATGVAAIDRLLGGGLTQGTVTVISGPTGVGKSTFGLRFLGQAAARGERAVLYSFEENSRTLRGRAKATGLPLTALENSGFLRVETVHPLRRSADEFTAQLREEVETRHARVVMIDSLSGYRLGVAGDELIERVLMLCQYLTNMGVTVLLINEIDRITGRDVEATREGISFLADAVVMLRYLEIRGELRKAIGVLKKRTGDFEKTLRPFDITADGLHVGEPLHGLRGLLRGNPEILSSVLSPGSDVD